MLPRLRAEESFLEANRTALGSGTVDRETATGIHQAWQRAAAGTSARASSTRAPRHLERPSPERLSAFGIGHRVHAREPKAPPAT